MSGTKGMLHYSVEIKKEAVRLVMEEHVTYAAVATKFGGSPEDCPHISGVGGGIIYILGNDLNFSGLLDARGGDGYTYSGAGAGGSIRIDGDDIDLGPAYINGGTIAVAGGQGRMAVYYQNTFSGSFTGYLEKFGAADSIFQADFETNNLNQWTSNVNDSNDLAASDSADYWGLYGMQAVIDDNTSIYVQDDTPNNEKEYRTRFYVNPNSVTMATNDILDLFTGYTNGTAVFLLQMQKSATSYQIRSGLLNDAGVWTVSSWYDISNDWNAVEMDYQSLLNGGNLTLWLNDVQKQVLWLIDNDTRTVTEVRLGAQGIETGTRGTVYFDDFESRRFSYIGTLPDPGVNDPQATNSAAWLTYTYHYTGAQPHAVTSMEIEGGSTNSYEYDQNGNTLAPHCTERSAMQCRCDLPRGERCDMEAKLQCREPHLCHPQDEWRLFHRHRPRIVDVHL